MSQAYPTEVSQPVPQAEEAEFEIAQVGQKYSVSFVSGGGFKATSISLTNHRLKGKGTDALGRKMTAFQANLQDVSSLSLEYSSDIAKLILGILLLPAFGLGLLLIIAYFMDRQRVITVNIQGNTYSYTLKGISNSRALEFIDQVITCTRLVKSGQVLTSDLQKNLNPISGKTRYRLNTTNQDYQGKECWVEALTDEQIKQIGVPGANERVKVKVGDQTLAVKLSALAPYESTEMPSESLDPTETPVKQTLPPLP